MLPDSATLAALIATHGYWLLALGCLIEGETVLLLAGFAVHRGHLNVWAVLAIASAAAFAGDQACFWLGRRHGARVLARFPAWQRQAGRVQRLSQRWGAPLVIGLRFAYGLRLAGPVLLGSTTMSGARFAIFNAIGALIWAVLVGGAGWAFGSAAELLLRDIRQVEALLIVALAVGALAWWAWRRRRAR